MPRRPSIRAFLAVLLPIRLTVRLTVPLVVAAMAGTALVGTATVGAAESEPGSAGGTAERAAAGTYTNPVTQGYSIDFPDPAVIRGKDGYWYGYSTGGPYDEQNQRGSAYKIARSADLVTWEDMGSVFDANHRPSWADPTTGFWAPDIAYVNGQYLLYFTVPNTTAVAGAGDPGIGVATAPHPAGPWTPADEPLIPPEPLPGGGFASHIDPALFTDLDGTNYLYWGGYRVGDFVVELTDDGLNIAGERRQVASTRFEGPYVMRHDGWYYLFASSANCCAGPTTGYTVFTGRSKSPYGPFVDKYGHTLTESRTGGTPVITQNGNRWIGTGHHSAVVDLSGQTWMAYHAIDRNDPWLDVSPGFTMRPMNLDRLDWIDGWPIVRAGRGASAELVTAPVTTGEVDERFADDQLDLTAVKGQLVRHGDDPHTGGYGQLSGGALALSASDVSSADVRVEADVRSGPTASVGVVAGRSGARQGVRAVVDAATRRLRVESYDGSAKRSAPLPANFDPSAWHTVALEVRGGTASAEVTHARRSDPVALVSVDVAGLTTGRAGVVSGTGGGEVANVSAHPLFEPVTELVPTPEPGAPAADYSDEFDGGLGAGWTWHNEDPNAVIENGSLVWPTQDGDIVGTGPPPGLLLRELPAGEFLVETKLSLDLGVDTVRNFQQAGLLVHVGNDEFLRLDVVAIGGLRAVEYGKETVLQDRRNWGGAIVGPPGETTWLRLHHTVDPDTGEHLYRAASSPNGVDWTWGATWTLPAGTSPTVGLVSHGSNPAVNEQFGRARAAFEYFRVSQPG